MSDNVSNNKRIAKNTILLYIRTFIILLISLYTSRVVLSALGVEDYGTYNVVGGFVAMFSLLSGALSNAISRYITFELGRGDNERLKDVFSTSVTVQIILAFAIVFLAEAFGIWFLNAKMNIPEGRMVAANWVFQCSLLTFAINLISVPYNACIIAHERMNVFAYVSILEAVLKLVTVLLLFIIGFDRLTTYAILMVFVAAVIRLIYGVYCGRHFEECHYQYSISKPLIKEMSSLASWNMLGAGGAILNDYGVNVIMNMFFGVRVNAARGLSVQVNAAVTQFVNSFTTAVNPQITKSYAREDTAYTFSLVMMSSKYSFFLMLLFAVPLIAETPYLLEIWLKNVPAYTVLFVRLTLIISLISTLSTSLYTLAISTGNIKQYQIIVGSLGLSCFFFTYVLYMFDAPVETTYFVSIFVNIIILFARLLILSKQTGLNMGCYLKKVVIRTIIVTIIVGTLSYGVLQIFSEKTFVNAIAVVLMCELFAVSIIILCGLSKYERSYLLSFIFKKETSNEINHD